MGLFHNWIVWIKVLFLGLRILPWTNECIEFFNSESGIDLSSLITPIKKPYFNLNRRETVHWNLELDENLIKSDSHSSITEQKSIKKVSKSKSKLNNILNSNL